MDGSVLTLGVFFVLGYLVGRVDGYRSAVRDAGWSNIRSGLRRWLKGRW